MMKPISDKWIENRLLFLKKEIAGYPLCHTAEERTERRTLLELQRTRAAIRIAETNSEIAFVSPPAYLQSLFKATLPEYKK